MVSNLDTNVFSPDGISPLIELCVRLKSAEENNKGIVPFCYSLKQIHSSVILRGYSFIHK